MLVNYPQYTHKVSRPEAQKKREAYAKWINSSKLFYEPRPNSVF